MHVRDFGRRLGALVRAAVQDRHAVAAVDEPAQDRDAARPGAPDDENLMSGLLFASLTSKLPAVSGLPSLRSSLFE